MPSQPTLREAVAADAPPAGAICYLAFKTIAERHGFPADFPDVSVASGLIAELIGRDDVHAVVAEHDGRVVGSNFLWEDEDAGGVGPITIDPSVQNQGIGRGLMGAVLARARARGIVRVRLVQAAYHGRSLSLYTRLGFAAREPLSVVQGRPLALRMDNAPVRAMSSADLDAANALCRRVHGIARSAELRAAIRQGTAAVVERDGRLTGYTTGIGFFGHAVAQTPLDLQALIGAAPAFAGPGFMVPTRDTALMQWCLERGLRIVQPMTLMTIGPYEEPRGAFLPSILY